VFVGFHDTYGQKVYLNPTAIVSFSENDKDSTAIKVSTGDVFYVKESLDTVYNQISLSIDK
jgi:uncharacterized protein YlzI (FlbEa/FlbD family)